MDVDNSGPAVCGKTPLLFYTANHHWTPKPNYQAECMSRSDRVTGQPAKRKETSDRVALKSLEPAFWGPINCSQHTVTLSVLSVCHPSIRSLISPMTNWLYTCHRTVNNKYTRITDDLTMLAVHAGSTSKEETNCILPTMAKKGWEAMLWRSSLLLTPQCPAV